MSDLFNEVEEQLRQDRYVTLWRRFGAWIIGAAAAALLGATAYVAYQHFSTQGARAHAEAFGAAQRLQNEGDLSAAKAAFEGLLNRGPSVYRQLARMHLASIQVEEGDLAGAAAAFDAIAEAASDDLLRDTARLRAAYLVADTQDFAAVRARLEPLLAAPGPMRSLARELLAMEAWEAGDEALARATFEAMTLDFDTPEELRGRAQTLLTALPRAPEAPAPAADDTAAPDSPAAAAAPP